MRKSRIKTKLKILIILNILLIIFISSNNNDYDPFRDQGILIKDNKIIVFKPYDCPSEFLINPEYEKKLIKNNQSYKTIKIYYKLFFHSIIKSPYDSTYFKNMLLLETNNYLFYKNKKSNYNSFNFLIYQGNGLKEVYITKYGDEWEKLEIRYLRTKNYWPKDSWMYKDYKATIYIRCKYFKGEYDIFYYNEPG